MASRDVRPIIDRSRRGSYGRSGGSYRYHVSQAVDRSLWEWFQSWFLSDPTLEHLLSLEDAKCYACVTQGVEYYGLLDIAYMWAPGWAEGQDTRAHRLVVKHLSESAWLDFHTHLVEGYKRFKTLKEEAEHERAEQHRQEHAAWMARIEAERIQREENDRLLVHDVVDITAGLLESELHQVMVPHDRVGDHGDWIDDTVSVYTDGTGFGYEEDKAKGIKLQITLSLDLSNSMYYNGVHTMAAAAFRDLGMSLKALKCAYADDLYVAFFTFSDDYYNGRGKCVRRLEIPSYETETYFGEFKDYRPSIIESWHTNGIFSGTDTWMAPLFAKIEDWENKHSDSGAVRLDIVITDAVIEHKKDLQLSDEIQERRNVSLQTVFLNFSKPEDSISSSLPKRCFQVHVDCDNIAGILRNILSEFVGANL